MANGKTLKLLANFSNNFLAESLSNEFFCATKVCHPNRIPNAQTFLFVTATSELNGT
jgi:hypothetical protein